MNAKGTLTNGLISTAVTALLIAGAAGSVAAQEATCGSTTFDLYAGQHLDVGSVTVSNDSDNLYVNYHLDYQGASFGTLHAWAGGDVLDVPSNKQGTPVPGQFPYKPDATGLTDYTITIPFSAINVAGVPVGTCQPLNLAVVTHAEVSIDYNGNGVIEEDEHETAFGGDNPVDVDSPGRWWYYGGYNICCDAVDAGQVCFTETAFAKGGYIWTTFKKSNPDKLPSLNLTKNRWGWAINLEETGEQTFDIWAGAGLNNTDKGLLVGALTVNWDGANATVSYDLYSGNALEEVHIYASDATPTTVAPGQYGFPEEGYDVGGAQSFSTTVPLADVDGDGKVWIIAHAAVSGGNCD